MAANHHPAVFIMGPTASGKTDVAAALYDRFDCELISVDAAQVFRSMNIGTAKPEPGFLDRYPHHLIDIRDYDGSYSAAEFCEDSEKLIRTIQRKHRIPVLVGGTMFYFSALENGLHDLPSTSAEIRSAVETQIAEQGLEAMHNALVIIDPEMGKRIKPTDRQRISRALEIYRISGKPPSMLMQSSSDRGLTPPPVKIALCIPDRKRLHRRIAERFNDMIETGLVEEVEKLIADVENPENLVSMRCVGYRQVLNYLRGKCSYAEMVETGITATRQLAKRQLTWLRNQSNMVWFDASRDDLADSMCRYMKARLLGI